MLQGSEATVATNSGMVRAGSTRGRSAAFGAAGRWSALAKEGASCRDAAILLRVTSPGAGEAAATIGCVRAAMAGAESRVPDAAKSVVPSAEAPLGVLSAAEPLTVRLGPTRGVVVPTVGEATWRSSIEGVVSWWARAMAKVREPEGRAASVIMTLGLGAVGALATGRGVAFGVTLDVGAASALERAIWERGTTRSG